MEDKVEKDEQKKQKFDNEFKAFIKLAKEVLKDKYGTSAIDLGECVEAKSIDSYMAAYNRMDPQEHYQYFESLYGRNRKNILTCLEDDHAWVQFGKIIIQFGEGLKVANKAMAEKRKAMYIDISTIYLLARDLKLQTDETLSGIDEKFTSEIADSDKYRPDLLLLHVLRIFYFLNDGADKQSLLTIVNKIEENIFGSKKTEIPVVETNTNTQNTTGGLAGIFNIATTMAEKFGIKPNPGMKAPTEAELFGVLNRVCNDPNTTNFVQGIIGSLNGVNDIPTALHTVVNNLTANSANLEVLQSTINQSAQAAYQNNTNQNTNTANNTNETPAPSPTPIPNENINTSSTTSTENS